VSAHESRRPPRIPAFFTDDFLAAEVGVGLVVMGEREIALAMAEFAMQRLGLDLETAQETVDALRAEAAAG
jgi:monovalent cation:H+ antiporter-2, CPA2 family